MSKTLYFCGVCNHFLYKPEDHPGWATNIQRELQKIMESLKSEPIDHPSHYTQSSIEPIDAIEACGALTDFCRGNAITYLWRMFDKDNPLEEAKKAEQYLQRLIQHLETIVHKANYPPLKPTTLPDESSFLSQNHAASHSHSDSPG